MPAPFIHLSINVKTYALFLIYTNKRVFDISCMLGMLHFVDMMFLKPADVILW
jgi:hypothetical protein